MARIRPEDSRGYRNRNPGNIDHVPANRWQGLADPPLEPTPRDGSRRRFAMFVSHEYGIRALAMLLTTYQDRHGLRTIREIVNRWAPPVENVTSSYVRFVDEQLPRHSADDVLDLHSYADMRELVEAIIRHELGGMPYSPAQIDAGLRLAGLVPPAAAVAIRSTTVRAAAATATAAIAVPQVLDLVVQAAPALASLQGLSPWIGAAVVLGVAGWFIAGRLQRV